jgi:integrase
VAVRLPVRGQAKDLGPRRLKMRRPHRVPLALQSVAILRNLEQITGNGPWLFPSVRTIARPISENTLNAALRRLGYSSKEMSTHGFRAMAATRLNEMGRWNPDAIERQLSHQEANAVRRAYTQRAEYWPERVSMMQEWADYLDELRDGGKVLPPKKAKSDRLAKTGSSGPRPGVPALPTN